ncbi:KGGVGR-motif variant AAA ATPase [Pseudomonas fluorescens]
MKKESSHQLRYDDVLPELVSLIISELGENALDKNLILRDADGFVTFVLREDFDAKKIEKLSNSISTKLKKYASNQPVSTPSEMYSSELSAFDLDQWELVKLGNKSDIYVRYIERRIVGGDWVRGMLEPLNDIPPVVVFSSHKGGVGRSTALSVAASNIADTGKSVLAIDLDLEAPGIGGMFHSNDALPEFGAIDYYVEFGRSEINDSFLNNMAATSKKSDNGGSITIVPAAGKACKRNPENVIGKISRAYLESLDDTGATLSFLDKTRSMLMDLCRVKKYDVIFIDARAGLNESTATTIQGLGADVLFFGIDTPQTWEGYNYFLSHLSRYKSDTSFDNDWRYKIKMVHAKAANSSTALAKFRDESFELFASYLYDEIDGNEAAEGLPNAFSFDLDDPTAPHFAWPIYISSDFYEFDPVANKLQLSSENTTPVFGDFINALKDRLGFQ